MRYNCSLISQEDAASVSSSSQLTVPPVPSVGVHTAVAFCLHIELRNTHTHRPLRYLLQCLWGRLVVVVVVVVFSKLSNAHSEATTNLRPLRCVPSMYIL